MYMLEGLPVEICTGSTDAPTEILVNPSDEVMVVSWHTDRALTTGNLGSLSQTMDPEEVADFVKENSLTQFTRERAAKRIGRRAL